MRRAVGIVRVSQARGREGESFASPVEQRQRIADACARDGFELVVVHEEIDVSGGTPLARRAGLSEAIAAIEGGHADVLMVAYFDRLVRSLRVQDEIVSRVEAAGGRVLALDIGEVTGKSAAQWLSGTMLGAVSEYYRRSIGERLASAQERAVARGVVPWPSIPPGYVRGPSGVLEPDAAVLVTARRAFEMRSEGTPIRQIRAFLRESGIEKSFHGVGSMLRDRLYIGEIHFGKLVNLQAHEPIIDRELFEAVQRIAVPRGRKAHSDRLLARLGILRCGTCGARMVVATAGKRRRPPHARYWVYRCPPTGDCPNRMAIAAEIAEEVVVARVREELADVEGRASAARDAHAAAIKAQRDQENLEAAIRAFAGVEDEPATKSRIAELVTTRDASREEAHRLSHLSLARTYNLAERWDDLTLAERRKAITLTVARALVMPGKGAGRIRVELLGEQAAGD